MIAVSGATGHLGRLVIEQLSQKVPPSQLIAIFRNPEKAKDLAAKGIHVRKGDYDQPQTLESAIGGAEKLLLISAPELGKRARQHESVIAAAKKAGVKLLVYMSLLHADRSSSSLAPEHLATEQAIRASGLPFVFAKKSEDKGVAVRASLGL